MIVFRFIKANATISLAFCWPRIYLSFSVHLSSQSVPCYGLFFVPKRKHLNDLLSEFHSQYHHQAIAMDEFGRVAGFVSLSDMMGEILGEIGDEFDSADRKGEIFNLSDHSFSVSVDTTLDWLFEVTRVPLIHSNMACDFNTLGALITHQIGHSHRRDEHQTMMGFDFRMLHPESGVMKWFKVSPVADASS
jgi:magnesium and cobalt transporter